MNFISNFENRIKKTIKDYDLFNKKDKILVAVSGGKDSTTVLYLLKKFGYKIEAAFVDVKIGKYYEVNLENITNFCKENDIKLHVFDIRKEIGYSMCYIQSVLASKGIHLKSCTICGIIKRYILNKRSREMGFTKLVTGHNLDDEAQTFLMNQFKGNIKLSAKLGPKSGLIKDSKFVQRVKPLYFSKEDDIEKYSKLMKFPVNYELCPCSSNVLRRNIINILYKYDFKIKNIVKYFLKLTPKIAKEYSKDLNMGYCNYCGEPSAKEICNTCKILKALKQ